MSTHDPNWGFETVCQHTAEDYRFEGAVVPPIFQTSLFTYETGEAFENRLSDEMTWDYTRVSNPTTDIAEKKIAALEGGEKCRLFGSGMAAISAAVMSACKAGSHIVCTNAAYGPTKYLMQHMLPRFGVTTTYVDGRDTDAIRDALRDETTVIYIESPGSFFFDIQDIPAIVQMARERGIVTIADNSNCSPYYQRPLSLGVDLVVHSATKYLGGHSDIVCGAAIGSRERMKPLIEMEGLLLGGILDPFAAWLMIRSLRTLALRMERHAQSARAIAEHLVRHDAVSKVYYPGLPTHLHQDRIAAQMRGASGLITFRPAFQDKQSVYRFCESLRLFQIGVSWGGHESLAIPVSVPEKAGKWYVRMSIGLESVQDLIADLDAAFASL